MTTQSDFCCLTDQKCGGKDDCHVDLGGDSSNSSGYTLKVLRRQNGQAGMVLPQTPVLGNWE